MSSTKTILLLLMVVILLTGTAVIVKNQIKSRTLPIKYKSNEATNTGENRESFPLNTNDKQTIVTLSETNDSSQSGTAVLTDINDKLVVTVDIDGAPEETEQPAHVHSGTCSDVGDVKYPLVMVLDGSSETTIDTSLTDLKSQLPLIINVHKSKTESQIYVACGILEI